MAGTLATPLNGAFFPAISRKSPTSVVVSKFAPLPISTSLANFETKTTLEINKLLVSFRFRNSPGADIKMMRISESGH